MKAQHRCARRGMMQEVLPPLTGFRGIFAQKGM